MVVLIVGKNYNSGQEYRTAVKQLQDPLSEQDQKWWLCLRTGRSYQDLLSLAALVGGDVTSFENTLGFQNLRRGNKYTDYNWWLVLLSWLRLFIPQWENKLRTTVETIIPTINEQQVLEVAAKALNIAPEVLSHLVQHQEEIETFLSSMRSSLGTLAEAKLWELVAQGDAATIRWLLPRLKSDLYGDKLLTENTPRHITIVEQ